MLFAAYSDQVEYFELLLLAEDEIGNGPCFGLGEGIPSRIDLAAHILTGAFTAPLVTEVAIGVSSDT